MIDTDLLNSNRHYEEEHMRLELDLLEVMLDLDPGMLLWTPR